MRSEDLDLSAEETGPLAHRGGRPGWKHCRTRILIRLLCVLGLTMSVKAGLGQSVTGEFPIPHHLGPSVRNYSRP